MARGRPPQDPARRLERAHRILDAAGELIVRWGYGKTTIDDVARQAGVAKGTIYLHWRTRDDLFAALLRRERVRMIEEIRAGRPGTLSALMRGFVTQVLARPLLRAALMGDPDVLGKLARMKRESTTGLDLGVPFDSYIGRLIDHGAARKEPGDPAIVLASIVHGFVLLPNMLPEPARPSDERIAELVADTIDRALTPGGDLPEADARAVAAATLDFLDTMLEVARRKLDASLGCAEPAS